MSLARRRPSGETAGVGAQRQRISGLMARTVLTACDIAGLEVPRARAALAHVSPLRRLDWEDIAALFEELDAACAGDEARYSLFAAALTDHGAEQRLLAVSALGPERLYRLLFLLSAWACPGIARRARYGRRRLDVLLELDPALRGCEAYFRVNGYATAYVTTALGLPPCRFEARVTERGGSYTYFLPEHTSLTAKARSATKRICDDGLAWLVGMQRELRRRFGRG